MSEMKFGPQLGGTGLGIMEEYKIRETIGLQVELTYFQTG